MKTAILLSVLIATSGPALAGDVCPAGFAFSGECADAGHIEQMREEALWRGQAEISLSAPPVPLTHEDQFVTAARYYELLDNFGERPGPPRVR